MYHINVQHTYIGRDGLPGATGLPGTDGKRGPPGEPGRDGIPGASGQAGGVVYTRWGRNTCGNESSLIYAGTFILHCL